MALTVADCEPIIVAHLGGEGVLPANWYVNQLGYWWTNTHPWKYLQGATTTLDLTAAQEYVALPADFASVVSLRPTDERTSNFYLTTIDGLEARRSGTVIPELTYWGAIVHAQTTDDEPTQRLELYPTPASTTTTGYFRLAYRRDWREVTGDQAKIDLPRYLEVYFITALGEFVRSVEDYSKLEEQTGRPGWSRMDMFKRSEWFRDACSRDGGVQTHYGMIENGAASASSSSWNSRFWLTVPDPS